MTTKYIIVIGDNPALQLAKNSSKFFSYKECGWLYDGVLSEPNLNTEKIKNAFLKHPNQLPQIIIENSNWISSDKFSHESWIKNLNTFIDMVKPSDAIGFYSCEFKK